MLTSLEIVPKSMTWSAKWEINQSSKRSLSNFRSWISSNCRFRVFKTFTNNNLWKPKGSSKSKYTRITWDKILPSLRRVFPRIMTRTCMREFLNLTMNRNFVLWEARREIKLIVETPTWLKVLRINQRAVASRLTFSFSMAALRESSK